MKENIMTDGRRLLWNPLSLLLKIFANWPAQSPSDWWSHHPSKKWNCSGFWVCVRMQRIVHRHKIMDKRCPIRSYVSCLSFPRNMICIRTCLWLSRCAENTHSYTCQKGKMRKKVWQEEEGGGEEEVNPISFRINITSFCLFFPLLFAAIEILFHSFSSLQM